MLRRTREATAMAGGWLMAECPPHVVGAHALSAISVGPVERLARGVAAQGADVVLRRALCDGFGDTYPDLVLQPAHPRVGDRPRGPITVLRHRRRYTSGTADVRYGDRGPAHNLDIWHRSDLPAGHRGPVLIHIPGGAWSVNDKRGQGYSLLAAMAERGWICVSVNYRRSPHHAWPAHIVDVKRAIVWVKRNIATCGGDPNFIALTGGSAGGHLSALAALTPNAPQWQPGFEEADTTVQAAAPLYGVFDLTDAGLMHPKMMSFLERYVLQCSLADNRAFFEQASPVHHVDATAPPFFVLHGQRDSIVPPSQSRAFASALRSAGAVTALHAELPNAHHMFDAPGLVRSHIVAESIATYLGIVYGRRADSYQAVGPRAVRR